MASRKTGDWAKAREIFETMSVAVDTASQKAISQEAHSLRGEIVKGIASQEPGGKAFKPLSPLTLAARRLAGLRGTKALIARSDLFNSIRVERMGKGRFIGILRTARGKKNGEMVNVGQVHEYGASPFVIPPTEKVRRYLAVLLKAAKLTHEPDIPRPWWLLKSKANPKKTLIIRIPARPLIRPIFDGLRQARRREEAARGADGRAAEGEAGEIDGPQMATARIASGYPLQTDGPSSGDVDAHTGAEFMEADRDGMLLALHREREELSRMASSRRSGWARLSS